MCLVLYLGSDRQRPCIAWDSAAPRFHVSGDDPHAQKAARHFCKAKSYYVGSDNHCGCGFRQEHDAWIDDPQQLASKQDNQQRLHDYVAACLRDEDEIELYCCWSGDEGLPIEHRRLIAVAEFLDPRFYFRERELTTVVASAATQVSLS